MHVTGTAIVCAVRAHGEHGAIVRALTPGDGLLAGYVRGGRSRRLRPVLMPGNIVQAEFRARSDDQLAGLAVELIHSRAPLFAEPLPAAAIDWVCALTAAVLPEGQPYPRAYDALDAMLAAIEAAPAARGWAATIVRYELLLLADLGFGLDLERCVATGSAADLAYVSPRSGAAVSEGAGAGHADRLLPLPRFLIGGGAATGADVTDGLRLSRHFLGRDLLVDHRRDLMLARDRFVERLLRAVA